MANANSEPSYRLCSVDAQTQTQARALILAGLGEHFGFIDPGLNPDLDDILTAYLARGDTFWVILDGDQVIATGASCREAVGVSRVVRMSVAAAYRRQGLGGRMLAHLLDLARRQGDHEVRVETNLDWWPARRLYQRFGFVVVAEDAEAVHMRLCLAG